VHRQDATKKGSHKAAFENFIRIR